MDVTILEQFGKEDLSRDKVILIPSARPSTGPNIRYPGLTHKAVHNLVLLGDPVNSVRCGKGFLELGREVRGAVCRWNGETEGI